MTRRVALALLVALLAGCGGDDADSKPAAAGGPYSVSFHITGYNFDPTGGNMRVQVTYYAHGVGAANESIHALPWSSSPVPNVPSRGNAYISGRLSAAFSCNNSTVTVSILANGEAVATGTFACGADFSLHKTLP